MVQKIFAKDEKVYGKWPGSTLYYKGVVKDYEPIKKLYTIVFDNDKSDTELSADDVKAIGFIERKRSRSRSSSPSRRRRARSKSPTRRVRQKPQKEISPSKTKLARSPRSPARVVTQKLLEVSKSKMASAKRVLSETSTTVEKEEIVMQSKDVITSDADSTVETISSHKVEEISQSRESDVRETSVLSRRRVTSKPEEKKFYRMTTRSTTRVQQPQQLDESVDEDEKQSVTLGNMVFDAAKLLTTNMGYILMAMMPFCFTYWVILSCAREDCSLIKRLRLPTLNKIFSWKATGYAFGWYLFQGVLSVVPIGKCAVGPAVGNRRRLVYRLNGLFAFIVTLAVYGIMFKLGKFPMDYIAANYLSLATGSFIFSFMLGLAVFIQTRYFAEDVESSGGILADFVFGRSLSPRFFYGNFDVKLYSFRAGNIGWAMMNIYFLHKSWDSSVLQKNPSLVLVTTFQVFYTLIHLVYEETLLYTGTFSVEKMGFLALGSMMSVFIFFCSMHANYLFIYPRSVSWYLYVFPVLLQAMIWGQSFYFNKDDIFPVKPKSRFFVYVLTFFSVFSLADEVIGAYIYTMAILQKFNFRKDPHQAKMTGVAYIHTSTGRDILVDGWWGKLRHPNYLGDFMMNLSWSIICGVNHIIPWIWSVSLFFLLLSMAVNDDKKCRKKYRSSWDEYRERVRYSFIPFVY